MKEHQKDSLKLIGKGVGIASLGATSQTITAIGASMFWQVPVVIGFGYLTYSSSKQVYRWFTKDSKKDSKKF
ncbi:hypothetical protein AB3N02_22285 [Priestia aryabhattai]|uniref:hypothetical protein n=1 Tax=Priestia aryabhattai TaxID=412384 RepID=UPI0039A38AE5